MPQNMPEFMSWDADTNIVTIDGIKFSREVFRWLGAGALGNTFRLVARADGVVTVDLVERREP